MYGRRSLSLPNGQLGRAERFADDVTGEEGEIYEPVTCPSLHPGSSRKPINRQSIERRYLIRPRNAPTA